MEIERIKSILQQLKAAGELQNTIITHTLVIEKDELVGKTDIQFVMQDKTLHNEEIAEYFQKLNHGCENTTDSDRLGRGRYI